MWPLGGITMSPYLRDRIEARTSDQGEFLWIMELHNSQNLGSGKLEITIPKVVSF